jgi:hypothetical protein
MMNVKYGDALPHHHRSPTNQIKSSLGDGKDINPQNPSFSFFLQYKSNMKRVHPLGPDRGIRK